MSRFRLIILAALLLLMAAPAGAAFAQEAEPVLISADESAATGTAFIWDDLNLSDAITYSLVNVVPPEEGTVLVGWLVSDADDSKLSTGPMLIDEGTINHTFDHNSPRYTGANLIRNYNRVVITVELGDVDAPAGLVAFEDVIEGGAITHVRHLVADWSGGSGAGILTNLKGQLTVAIEHADHAIRAATLDLVKLHTRHVINIIEGVDGANFDASAGNPGDGLGVLLHAADRKHSGFAASGFAENDLVAIHAALVDVTGMNAETSTLAARDAALQVLSQTDKDIAKVLLAPVKGHLTQALDGRDADADGTIASIEGEGAAANAYVEAQRMVTFTFLSGAVAPPPVVVEPPDTVGDPTVPLLVRIALIASLTLMAVGGLLAARGWRSRAQA